MAGIGIGIGFGNPDFPGIGIGIGDLVFQVLVLVLVLNFRICQVLSNLHSVHGSKVCPKCHLQVISNTHNLHDLTRPRAEKMEVKDFYFQS